MIRSVRHLRAVIIVLVLAVVAGTLYYVVFGSASRKHVTMYFENSIGLYSGDEVKILGVTVGEVDKITPTPTDVRVEMSYDSDRVLPANVKGAIVAPSLVTGRFVQLAPAYAGGAVLPNNAVITYDAKNPRTAVPVEWPQVEKQLTRLVTALGPNATSKKGTLSELVTTAAANLNARTAKDLRSTLSGLSDAVGVLNSSKGNLFATVRNLNSFIGNLAQNDAAVAGFASKLDAASGVLSQNSGDLKQAVRTLQPVLNELRQYVDDNRSAVTTTVSRVGALAQTLNAEKYALADIVHQAPTALDNFYNVFDPRFAALDGRLSLTNFQNLSGLLCSAGGLSSLTPAQANTSCTALVELLAGTLGLKGSAAKTGAALPTASPATTSPSSPGNGPTAAPTDPITGTVNQVTGGLLGLLAPGGSS